MLVKKLILCWVLVPLNVVAGVDGKCEERVEQITRAEFSYDTESVVGISSVIPQMCKTAEEVGADYYSVAIMTMLVAMNSLRVNERDQEIKEFIEVNAQEVLRLANERGNQPIDEINRLLSGIKEKHGL
jgi:hypothetical protein